MAKRKTNTAFVRHMMEYASSGPMMQAFIMEALSKYATACAAADPKVFDSGLMDGTVWHGCAVELRDALKEHFK